MLKIFKDKQLKKTLIESIENPVTGEVIGAVKINNNNEIDLDRGIIKVDENTYEVWKRDDGDLNFIFNYKDKEMSWRIEQSEPEDLYELFGKAGKYRAQLENKTDKNKLLDKGTIKLGSQRDGYHEYLLDGKLYSGKFHFRVVPIDGQKTWIAWTGYETKPTDKDSDEGMWNIEQDENKSLKYTE